jgi:hypothetical protein
MQSDVQTGHPCMLMILLLDASNTGGEPRAVVQRLDLPPLAFASVSEAVAATSGRQARR